MNKQNSAAPQGVKASQMERMRAAVTILNSGRFNERTKLIAFLSIQHPELKPDRIVAIANAWQDEQNRKAR